MSDGSRRRSSPGGEKDAENMTTEMKVEPDANMHQVMPFHSLKDLLLSPEVLALYPESLREKIVDDILLGEKHNRQMTEKMTDANIRVLDAKIKQVEEENKTARRLMLYHFIEKCFVFVIVLVTLVTGSYFIQSGKQAGWVFILVAALAGVRPLIRQVQDIFRKNGDDEGK